MSEKRFKKMDTIIDPFPIWDTVEEKGYNCTDTLDLLVGLLNEQQAIIKQLESDKAIAEDYANIFEKENVKLRIENKKLKEENEQLRQSVEYWQKKYEEGTETFQID